MTRSELARAEDAAKRATDGQSPSALDHALSRLDIDPNDPSPVSDAEARFLFRLVRDHGCRRTLEVGCGLGKSAVAIMSATDGPHTVIDPYQDNYGRRGIANIDRSGLGERLVFVPELSCLALPKLVESGARFDFVFIDGSHRFDDVLLDFCYADLLLDSGGYVVLDDLWMRTVRLVVSFVRRNRKDYSLVSGAPRGLAVFRKTGTDRRDGMFHREFYTPRSFASHHLLVWLSSGQSPMRSAVRAIKSALLR